MVQLIECPRDAMQGINSFIPTAQKVKYLNQLLQCGFHTLDFGSFVSPKAIPQLADTVEVIQQLELENTSTELLAIVANLRGAEVAVGWEEIKYIGYPFSISETFQLRNTQKTIVESLSLLKEIQDLCMRNRKTLVVYLSMGFGNPYGDTWSPEIVLDWAEKVQQEGVSIISLADTTGVATPESIQSLFTTLIPAWPQVIFGAHFHSTPDTWEEKIEAAWNSGCRRFDGALKGIGGCPFAKEELTGNLATENIYHWLTQKNIPTNVSETELHQALKIASETFA
jgi:hydroxymethylglutaryl-CoA lyase